MGGVGKKNLILFSHPRYCGFFFGGFLRGKGKNGKKGRCVFHRVGGGSLFCMRGEEKGVLLFAERAEPGVLTYLERKGGKVGREKRES